MKIKILPKEEPRISILPATDETIFLDNPDKKFMKKEVWTDKRDLANFIKPWRAWICGVPSVGKGCVLKHMIYKSDPAFTVIKVVHVGKTLTTEWDDCVNDPAVDILDEVPEIETWDSDEVNLLILDDIDCAQLPYDQKQRLESTLRFVSSHCNVSVAILNQDLLMTRAQQRRLCNVMVLYKIPDTDGLTVLARKCGIKTKYFKAIMKRFKSYHDYLVCDMTVGTPAPLRLNMYQKIILPEED